MTIENGFLSVVVVGVVVASVGVSRIVSRCYNLKQLVLLRC